MSCVLTVDSVNKRYPTYRSNLQRFANWFGASFSPVVEFWASRDISFQVRQGEAVALIGQNGAGKSTLLKMVTGTVRPTSGNIRVSGRISAILELGLGFNPEFTGRQNVYQAGGLMGFSRQELDSLIPAIEAFAEIGEFFDQPVRVYSSGMQARLAFALATAKRPDILIVDEVLSVGDSYFQHKSFDRIRQFKEEGTAILLVTHSLGDVRALCDRVILLDKGAVLKDGPPDEVVDYYNAMVADRENRGEMTIEQKRDANGWLHTRSGTFDTIVRSVELLDTASSMAVSTAVVGQKLTLRVDLEVQNPVPKIVLGIMLRDRTGHVVWGTNTSHTNQTLVDQDAGQHIRFDTEFDCNLGPGSFSFTTAITGSDTNLDGNYDWQDNVLVFDVVNTSLPFFVGSNAIPARINIARVD
jgi:lipopolysaccharide transport system ATP-binding protein